MRLKKQGTPLIAINVELETRSGAAGHQTIHSYDSATSKDDVHSRPEVGEVGVVGPISNAPVYPEIVLCTTLNHVLADVLIRDMIWSTS